jgi:ASPIC and UnbV
MKRVWARPSLCARPPPSGGDKRPSTAWHAEFADFNNDGLSDIFVSTGNLEQMPDFAAYDPSNLLLGQWNGKFAEAGDESGIACDVKGRGDASGHSGFIHVGIGTAKRAEISVQWPDGDHSPSYRVFANQFVVVDRTKSQAAYWYPAR